MDALIVNAPGCNKVDPARIDKEKCSPYLTCCDKCRFDAID